MTQEGNGKSNRIRSMHSDPSRRSLDVLYKRSQTTFWACIHRATCLGLWWRNRFRVKSNNTWIPLGHHKNKVESGCASAVDEYGERLRARDLSISNVATLSVGIYRIFLAKWNCCRSHDHTPCQINPRYSMLRSKTCYHSMGQSQYTLTRRLLVNQGRLKVPAPHNASCPVLQRDSDLSSPTPGLTRIWNKQSTRASLVGYCFVDQLYGPTLTSFTACTHYPSRSDPCFTTVIFQWKSNG